MNGRRDKTLSECWPRTCTIVTLTICLLSVSPPGSAVRSQVRPDIGPTEVTVLRDLQYASYQFGGVSKKLLLDLYLPQRTEQPSPLIIFLHGGGWFEGRKDTCPGRSFAARGYAVACVGYRLANHTAGCPKELSFPAQVHDVKAAVRWLRKHAGKYGINPNRFGTLGASSGGHLAVLLGVSPGVADLEGTENLGVSDEVQAVADWFAPVDVTRGPPIVFNDNPCSTSIATLISKYGGESTPYFYWTLAWATFLGGSLADPPVLKRAPRASPLTYIDSGDPPFLVIHGEGDNMVPINQSELLVAALRNAGVGVTFVRLPGVGHGFAGSPGSGREVDPAFFEPTIKFFDGRLRKLMR
ncbi:MAG TPA: alpha/beta hydrolase [Blastocatellia bacterium]|nr:alpha/beta hydrolase [Blastocatellia bacterium]